MGEWHTIPLGEVITFQRGYDLPHRARKTGNIPIVSSAGVTDYHDTGMVDPPGVITGRYGTIGEVFLITEPFWPLNTTLYVRDFHGNDQRFIYYLLQRFDFYSFSGKSGIPGVNRNDLHAETVTLPVDINEQRAIAVVLSEVDALLDGLDRLIAKKRDLKQATMQQLLTGQSRLPGYSGEWEIKTLFDLAERKKELFDDGDWIESEHITTEGIRLIQTGNIGVGSFIEKEPKKFIYEKSFTSLRCKQLMRGDLLVCRLADPAGRACVLPDIGEERIVTSVDVTIFRPPLEMADRVFIANVFSTPEWFQAVSDRSGGTTHKRISRGALGRIAIKLPPLAEQTAIAAILSDMDAELLALEARRDKTLALKQAMMQELLTGKTRLLAPPSNVVAVDFAASSKSAPAQQSATKSHNWEINEAVVVAMLVKKFGSEQYPLGRMRCTKLVYLMHRYVEHVAQGYLKKAAGPYNPAVKYKGPERIAQKNGYIRHHINGKFSGYVAAENIAKAENYFQKWYGQDVLGWLERFRKQTNDELELLATVDMAVEDLKRLNQRVTTEAVKSVIHNHPEWEAKLERVIFSDINIARAIRRTSELFSTDDAS